jgi:hypothetical protein
MSNFINLIQENLNKFSLDIIHLIVNYAVEFKDMRSIQIDKKYFDRKIGYSDYDNLLDPDSLILGPEIEFRDQLSILPEKSIMLQLNDFSICNYYLLRLFNEYLIKPPKLLIMAPAGFRFNDFFEKLELKIGGVIVSCLDAGIELIANLNDQKLVFKDGVYEFPLCFDLFNHPNALAHLAHHEIYLDYKMKVLVSKLEIIYSAKKILNNFYAEINDPYPYKKITIKAPFQDYIYCPTISNFEFYLDDHVVCIFFGFYDENHVLQNLDIRSLKLWFAGQVLITYVNPEIEFNKFFGHYCIKFAESLNQKTWQYNSETGSLFDGISNLKQINEPRFRLDFGKVNIENLELKIWALTYKAFLAHFGMGITI